MVILTGTLALLIKTFHIFEKICPTVEKSEGSIAQSPYRVAVPFNMKNLIAMNTGLNKI